MGQLRVNTLSRRARGIAAPSVVLLLVCVVGGLGACGGGPETPAAAPQPEANRAASATSGLKRASGETGFYVDSVNGKVPDGKGTPIVVNAKVLPAFGIGGWAIDRPAQREAGGVVISIDNKTEVTATSGSDRPDVVKFLNSPNYLKSGFTAAINTENLEKGVHTLTFKVLTADKTGYYEPKDEIRIEIQK